MVDPIAQITAAAQQQAAAPAAQNSAIDPGQARSFAALMGEPSAAHHSAGSAGANQLKKSLLSQGSEYSEGMRALDESRHGLMSSSLTDPMMFMWRAVDFSYRSTTLFTRLNIATGLSTAASNSFNTLLKNQQ